MIYLQPRASGLSSAGTLSLTRCAIGARNGELADDRLRPCSSRPAAALKTSGNAKIAHMVGLHGQRIGISRS